MLGSGKAISSSDKMAKITAAVETGAINCSTYILEEGERLDHIAGSAYGDSSYWWVIAAASNIGWGLQVPPGTLLRIPTSIDTVLGIVL
jgi:nucleoid-associated protein YgaU